MNDLIPYTHWAYFEDRRLADACAAELDAHFDCLTTVDMIDFQGKREWLLRAARSVSLDWPDGWHREIESVVTCFFGRYDGGESGWLDTRTGQFLGSGEGRGDG